MYDEDKAAFKWTLIIGATVVALIVVGWVLSVALSGPVGKANVYRKTNGSDYGIANYDKFKDSCNAIEAKENQIVLARKTLDSDKAEGVDSGTLSRDRQNLNALENSRLGLIGEYNADASKTATAAKWRDADLPRHIDPNGETTCE